MNKKKIIYTISLLLSIGLIVFFIIKGKSKTKDIVFKNIIVDIKYLGNEKLILKEDIIKEMNAFHQLKPIFGQKKDSIPLNEIESYLKEATGLSRIEVWLDHKGNIRLNAEQGKPILQIATSEGMAFLDEFGNIFKPEKIPAVRLPIATGHISRKLNKKLYTFAHYVHQNSFLNPITQQIFVNTNGEFEIVPLIGNFRILFGDITRLDEKTKYLKAFYSKAYLKIESKKIKEIDLRFRQQIVCRK